MQIQESETVKLLKLCLHSFGLLLIRSASTLTNTNIARNLASLSFSTIWFHLVIIICELQTLERRGDAIPPQGARDTFG